MSRLKMKRKKALAEQLAAEALVSTVEIVEEKVTEPQPPVKKTKKKVSDEEE